MASLVSCYQRENVMVSLHANSRKPIGPQRPPTDQAAGVVQALNAQAAAELQTVTTRLEGALEQHGVYSAPPNPCDDPDFEWDEQVLSQVFDYIISTREYQTTIIGKALRELYRNRNALGLQGTLKPIHVYRVLKFLPYIAAVAEGAPHAVTGDWKKVGEVGATLAVSEYLTKRALIPAPLVGAMFATASITKLSFEERQRQEQLLDFDIGFYEFFDDTEFRNLLDNNPRGAVQHYIVHQLVNSRQHRKTLQAYIDLEMPEGHNVQVDGWRWSLPGMNGLLRAQLGLALNDGQSGNQLRATVLSMLREMELKRESMLPPDRATRLRNQMRRIMDDPAFSEWERLAAGVTGQGAYTQLLCQAYMKMRQEAGR